MMKLKTHFSLALYLGIFLMMSGCLAKLDGATLAHEAVSADVDTSCQAYADFAQGDSTNLSIQSRIYTSCQTCHSAGGGPGASMYSIIGPSPTDDQMIANYIGARSRMLYAADQDPSQSDLIQYGRGYKSHTGGAAFSLDDELALTNWANSLLSCTPVSEVQN